MKQRVELAKKGREFWLSLTKEYPVDSLNYVIVLPDNKKESNEMALTYLKPFMDKKGIQHVLLLTSDESVMAYKQQYGRYAQFLKVTQEEIRALLQFYSLYEFTTNIVVASLEQPAGRMGTGLIGKKGLRAEEVFAGIIYGLTE